MQEIFAAANIVLSLAILLYASWRDYLTREVSNRVWAVYAPVALALSLAQFLLFESSLLPTFALAFGVTSGFALLLFYTGGFGGADSKALMCIALSLPFFPAVLLSPLLEAGFSPLSRVVFPITVLSNSVLIAAASGFYLLLCNVASRLKTGKPVFEGTLAKEPLGKRILVLITGRRVPLSTLEAKWHVYPMEDIAQESVEGTLQRKLMIVPRDEGRNDVVARLKKAVDAGQIDGKVWATPGLPMLIFVTVGLIIALTLGDVVWLLISYLL